MQFHPFQNVKTRKVQPPSRSAFALANSKREGKQDGKRRILMGVSVVTLLTVFERTLGFFYRILLSRFIGAEGVGVYQVALSIFSLFLTVGVGGIPITLSRLIAKARAQNGRQTEGEMTGAGILLTLSFALPVSLFLFACPSVLSLLFSSKESLHVFRVLILGLLFACVYAVIRSSFWGKKQFLIPAVLELLEEAVMVALGVLLLRNLQNADGGAMRAGWAVTLSYVVACLFAILLFFATGGRLRPPKKQLKPLFNASLPITFVRISGSFISSAIAVILPMTLIKYGSSQSQAMSLFGIASGMVLPVLFIPATLIGSLSLVLTPEISETYTLKQTQKLYNLLWRGLYVAILSALFLIPFFYSLGDSLGTLAFGEPLAGEWIKKGSIFLLPMCITLISTAMLNSMGCEKQTLRFFFLGAASQLLTIFLLTKHFEGFTYVFSLGVSYVVTAICSLVLLHKKCPKLWESVSKAQGQGCVHGIKRAVFVPFCLALLGDIFEAVFSRFLGSGVATIASGICLFICSIFIWKATKLFPTFFLKKKNK